MKGSLFDTAKSDKSRPGWPMYRCGVATPDPRRDCCCVAGASQGRLAAGSGGTRSDGASLSLCALSCRRAVCGGVLVMLGREWSAWVCGVGVLLCWSIVVLRGCVLEWWSIEAVERGGALVAAACPCSCGSDRVRSVVPKDLSEGRVFRRLRPVTFKYDTSQLQEKANPSGFGPLKDLLFPYTLTLEPAHESFEQGGLGEGTFSKVPSPSVLPITCGRNKRSGTFL